ncbi:hypothetical protein PDIDSM_5633 [Penicillium digitatum]|nr:hypothetical protein PDIDSM_5633 [Penicillium digitatum]
MGKSSKDKRDAYYRLAKEQNWRARSAFKLIQIDERFDLFEHENPDSVTRVVDLCAAPGSWSQVLSRVLIKGESFGRRAWLEKKRAEQRGLEGADATTADDDKMDCDEPSSSPELKPRKNVKIVSIDLQPMAPLEGLHDLDIYIQSQLLYAALNLAMGVLRPGGKFVAKIFRGRDVDILYAQLRTVFERVSVAKPRSSRASSLEAFVVCEGFIPPVSDSGVVGMAALKNPLFGGAVAPAAVSEDGNVGVEVREEIDQDTQARSTVAQLATVSSPAPNHTTEVRHLQTTTSQDQPQPQKLSNKFAVENRWIPSFIACGDLSAWDSDATYTLPPDYVNLDPIQPPTAPPYRRALELRKEKGGAYGKTKLWSK